MLDAGYICLEFWLVHVLHASVVIGQCDLYFGFGFTTLNWAWKLFQKRMKRKSHRGTEIHNSNFDYAYAWTTVTQTRVLAFTFERVNIAKADKRKRSVTTPHLGKPLQNRMRAWQSLRLRNTAAVYACISVEHVNQSSKRKGCKSTVTSRYSLLQVWWLVFFVKMAKVKTVTLALSDTCKINNNRIWKKECCAN